MGTHRRAGRHRSAGVRGVTSAAGPSRRGRHRFGPGGTHRRPCRRDVCALLGRRPASWSPADQRCGGRWRRRGRGVRSAWRSLGVEVTLVEVLDHLVPAEDPSSSAALTQAFQRRGLVVRTGVGLASAKADGGGVLVELTDGDALMVDQVLVAVGRRPQTSGLGLQELDVLAESGAMLVDAKDRARSAGCGRRATSGVARPGPRRLCRGVRGRRRHRRPRSTTGRAPLDPPGHLLQPRGGVGRSDRARSPRPAQRRSPRRCFPWPATLGRSSRERGGT